MDPRCPKCAERDRNSLLCVRGFFVVNIILDAALAGWFIGDHYSGATENMGSRLVVGAVIFFVFGSLMWLFFFAGSFMWAREARST